MTEERGVIVIVVEDVVEAEVVVVVLEYRGSLQSVYGIQSVVIVMVVEEYLGSLQSVYGLQSEMTVVVVVELDVVVEVVEVEV